MKTIQQAIGSIPAGIQLLENDAQSDWDELETWAYTTGLSLLARLTFPILEWLPPWCKGWPKQLDLAVSLLSAWPDVLDQGQLGSCVDNAVSTSISVVEARETGQAFQASRLFLYGNARGWSTSDSGSSIGACAHGVSTYGAPAEALWPYDPSQFAVKPPLPVWTAALQHKLSKSFWTLSEGAILHSLNQGYPVNFCFLMFKSFGLMNEAQGWVCPMPDPNEAYIGGHCVTIRGYDLDKKLFLIQNSWGKGWGAMGTYWMPFDYVLSATLASGWRTFRKVTNG